MGAAHTDQDLEGIEHVIDTIGPNDAIMINIAKRLNAYLLTTEKVSSKEGTAFMQHALRKGVKVVTPCSWALATYYRTRIASRYVKSENTEAIIRWLLDRTRGEERQEVLMERFQRCEKKA